MVVERPRIESRRVAGIRSFQSLRLHVGARFRRGRRRVGGGRSLTSLSHRLFRGLPARRRRGRVRPVGSGVRCALIRREQFERIFAGRDDVLDVDRLPAQRVLPRLTGEEAFAREEFEIVGRRAVAVAREVRGARGNRTGGRARAGAGAGGGIRVASIVRRSSRAAAAGDRSAAAVARGSRGGTRDALREQRERQRLRERVGGGRTMGGLLREHGGERVAHRVEVGAGHGCVVARGGVGPRAGDAAAGQQLERNRAEREAIGGGLIGAEVRRSGGL